MNEGLKEQSNPFSTGGGGVNFETRVQAAFAISLLTGASVPCLPQSMRAKELKFQNKYNGVNTDDFVVFAADNNGQKSKLLAQIKHQVTVSESPDSVFSEVIKSAWVDYKSEGFNSLVDSIVLITGPIAKQDINNTLPILEWAKYSSSGAEFFKKVLTKGFTSEAKIRKLEVLKAQIVIANAGSEVSDEEVWGFLKIFSLISYDLDAKNSVVANLLCSLIQSHSSVPADLVLAKVIGCVQEFNQNAGTLTLETAPLDVVSLFQAEVSGRIDEDIKRLKDRGEHIFEGISNSVGGVHVDREVQIEEISRLCIEGEFLFVTGSRGAGKSGVVKDFILKHRVDVPVFYLRAEDLDRVHLNDVFSSIGMNSTLSEIAGKFSLLKEKILVIESVEKILELSYQSAFLDLLHYIKGQQGWVVIATGRDYAFQQLVFNYLQPSGVSFNSVNINGFTLEEVGEVCRRFSELESLVSNPAIIDLLRLPFFLDLAARAALNGAKFSTGDTEADFRNIVWATVISKETDRKGGMPLRRKKTFIEIAKQRAKKMVFGVRESGFDSEAISKLEEDNLIFRDGRLSLVGPSHDVLEDWALEAFIDGEYVDSSGDLSVFLTAIGDEPAISRAFRLWLYRKLKANDDVEDFVHALLLSGGVDSYWRDEAISALFQSDKPEAFIGSLRSQLLQNGCALLIRFLFVLRITCQRPDESIDYSLYLDKKSGQLKNLFLRPFGLGWDAAIEFCYEARTELSEESLVHVVDLLDEWSGTVNIYSELPVVSRTAGLLAIWLLEGVRDSYRDNRKRKKIISVLLKVSPAVETEFDGLMSKDVFVSKLRSDRPCYVDELVSMALVGLSVAMLTKRLPDFVIRLAMHEWLSDDTDESMDEYRSLRRMDVDESFGLDRERDFFPASGAKGPFKYLLMQHPRKALDFIIDLCNRTAEKYAASEFAAPAKADSIRYFSDEVTVKKLKLELNDGTVVSQYASPHLWKGYRGLSTLPYVLQCALMALEGWLVNFINSSDDNNQISWVYDYILRSSNSVMPTSVLASVATGFPEKVGDSAFPILKCHKLYQLDLQRMTSELGSSEPNWFASQLGQDVMAKIYVEERREAALRSWRKESIETLLIRLQFEEAYRVGALGIVDSLIEIALSDKNENLRFMIHRADTRKWKAVEDLDNNRVLFENELELPSDLKEAQQKFYDKHIYDGVVSKLYAWSKNAFDDNTLGVKYYSGYDGAVSDAKRLLDALQAGEIGGFANMAVGAITTAAAVCIRDSVETLSDNDKEWCFRIIIESAVLHADDGVSVHDVTDQFGSGACAFVLPIVLKHTLNKLDANEVNLALATALTHENLSVCAYAARGVREYLWSVNSVLASYCLAGVVEYARLRKKEHADFSGRSLKKGGLERSREKWLKSIHKFRSDLLKGCFRLDVESFSVETHSSWFYHLPMMIIPFGSTDSEHVKLIYKIVGFVGDDEYLERRSNDDEKINHDIKRSIQQCFSEHIVRSKDIGFEPFNKLLTSMCSRAPSFVYSVKLDFDVSMERQSDFAAIWRFWLLMAPEIHKIALDDVSTRYTGRQSDLNRLLRGMLYSDCPWQGHPSEDACIDFGAKHLIEFARQSAFNSHVFEAMCSLMYNFHDLFFEDGVYILSDKLLLDSTLIGKQVNSAYYLEMSIGRYLQVENRGVLGRKIHSSILCLLSGILETGSARAYYLRESLIRSRRIAV